MYIEGRLQTRNYEKDGVKRYITEIVADQLIMLDGGPRSTNGGASEAEAPSSEAVPAKENDLPF